MTLRGPGATDAASSCERQRKTTSAPHESAASFVMKRGIRLHPFRARRGSSAAAGSPARVSEPSA